jgi:hypothetical protein
MSDTILGGDITVYYFDENRQKHMEWTGSATGTRTVNEVYSAMATLLDEAATGDDATAMSAETPVEYTVGLIDANDNDPWYLQYELAQHLTGGAIRTSGWTRTEGSATGIVVVPVTSNTITTASVGFDITSDTDGDSGTLLEVIEQGATDYLVIRPDSSAAANSFDNSPTASQGLTCNAQTATQSAASTTGEQIWANAYNVTPIDADTHVYMYQGTVDDATRARIEDINVAGQDWWDEGAFDRLIYIRDYQTDTNPIIDLGYITVFARKGNTLYDSFEILTSTTSGGRNPVPLAASADGNNTTGYKSITLGGATGALATSGAVGDEIQGDTSGARAIVTRVDNPGATSTLHYYLIGDPQTDFNGSEAITDNDQTGAATSSGAVSPQGPALSTWFTTNTIPSAVHANTTFDIDDDGTAEGWAIDVDCQFNPLTEVYEWMKYVTRNGETGTTHTDGIEGEQYVGPTVYLDYGSSTVTGGTIAEGDEVTQETSGASGMVVSHDTTLKQIVLRDTRGTFATGSATDHTVTSTGNSGAVEMDSANATADNFNAVKAAPFGTLAGGRFFGARGVLLSDWLSADENNFQLIDSSGASRARPIAISLSVSNLVGTSEATTTDDYVVSHRLVSSGGDIDKTEYSAFGGEAIGASTLDVDAPLAADVPGKSAGGVVNLRDADNNNKHYRIRFSSWANTGGGGTDGRFTLANVVIAAADAATTTTIQETGAFTNAKRGDLVLNITRSNAVSYVTQVVDNDNVVISPAITGQTTGDNIELNACPIAVNTADDVYISLIDEFATASAASVSIVYVAPIDYRVKVSNTRNATKIKRFVTDDATSGTDRNVATIRNTDTIHT